jgi:hypothetical protein
MGIVDRGAQEISAACEGTLIQHRIMHAKRKMVGGFICIKFFHQDGGCNMTFICCDFVAE